MNESALHTVLVYGHALGGLVALGFGCFVLHPRHEGESALFRAFLVALWAMALLLVAVVGVDWRELPPVSRSAYSALTVLALYTGFRGSQARRLLRDRTPGWRGVYVGHVGFTLISLFDGFVVVGALDLDAPGWVVGTVGALGVVVGISAVNYVKARTVHPVDVAGVGASALPASR